MKSKRELIKLARAKLSEEEYSVLEQEIVKTATKASRRHGIRKYMKIRVDRALDDNILNRLNNILGAELVSICAGHYKYRLRYNRHVAQLPHLTFKISGKNAIAKTRHLISVLYKIPEVNLGTSYMRNHWEIYQNDRCVWPQFPFKRISFYTFLRIAKATRQSRKLTDKWFLTILKIIQYELKRMESGQRKD